MRYFTYIAEQAFRTSATGERLLCRGGPWSRPYIIPDRDTEQRLFKKHVWVLRIFCGVLFLGQPCLIIFLPGLFRQPYWFLIYLGTVEAVLWAASRIVFARDLKGLQRAPARLGPCLFYAQTAQHHSRTGLSLGFIGSLAFVAAGVWVIAVGANLVIGIVTVGVFGLCAAGWGYALYLKLHPVDLPDESENKGQA